MANPLVCIFNPVTTLIDEIQSQSEFTGASAAGSPVVLNQQGVIDPSFLGQGISATAGELLNAGALVNLYNVGGSRFMQNAYAAAVSTAPSGAAYPIAAIGFVNDNVSINNTDVVLFEGVFTYGDPHAEFTANDIGTQVFLSPITPGGVTKTRPSGSGQLQEPVGTVVGFIVPNFVQVALAIESSGGGGGSTPPGGSSGQVQYNNAGAFGGITASSVNSQGNIVIGPLPSSTSPPLFLIGDGTHLAARIAQANVPTVSSGVKTLTVESNYGGSNITGGQTAIQAFLQDGGGTTIVDTAIGVSSSASIGLNGTASTVYGVSSVVGAAGGNGNITSGACVYTQVQFVNGGTIATGYGVFVDAPAFLGSGGATLANVYGIYIADQTNSFGGSNNNPYALFVAGGVSKFTGLATAIVTKTSNYTLTQNDSTVLGNGTFTFTLPTIGIKVGQIFTIKNIATGVITVSSTVNIDAMTSFGIATQYDSITVQWDGTQYWII